MTAFYTTATAKDFAIIRARALAADMNDHADILESKGADSGIIDKIRKEAEMALIEAGDAPSEYKYNPDICPRCGGTGVLEKFKHVEGGRCFDCEGSGKA